jgi:response regulator RpfG family c-di-GMP phosphodiesterase
MKVLLVSGEVPAEALSGLAVSGADDFLAKPFRLNEFQSRVGSLLLRRSAGADGGQATIGGTVRVPAGATGPAPVRSLAAVETMSFMASQLLVGMGMAAEGHWTRITRYVRALAGAVSGEGEYARLKDDSYLDLLAALAPVHDIGLLDVPRAVLMKPDRLDMDEARVMQTHTTHGAQLLATVAGRFGPEVSGLGLAVELVRSHHERWDGSGYPDVLSGHAIPLSARVVALATVYEAVRSRRPHRPPLSHARAVKIITTESTGQFDPVLLTAFGSAAPRFELIHRSG